MCSTWMIMCINLRFHGNQLFLITWKKRLIQEFKVKSESKNAPEPVQPTAYLGLPIAVYS